MRAMGDADGLGEQSFGEIVVAGAAQRMAFPA